MLDKLKSMFGLGNPVDFSELIKSGGIIVDVRSPGEFKSGHIKGAKNIPLDRISGNLKAIKDKNQPIITCCASGMRSASAKGILKSNGYTQVYNGGG